MDATQNEEAEKSKPDEEFKTVTSVFERSHKTNHLILGISLF